MTTILIAKERGRILFACEKLVGAERYMQVCRRLSDGTITNDWHKVDNVGPLVYIPGGPDIDDIAVRDMVQMIKANPPPVREDKPNITELYLDFQEGRRMEMSGRRTHAMWPRKDERTYGSTDRQESS